MLSNKCRRHDVVLFGDVNYDVRSAHWCVNNTTKMKNYSFSRVMRTFSFSRVRSTRENSDVFITLDENIYAFHSKRVNILCLLYILTVSPLKCTIESG